jgi:hypothetical protein
MPDQTAIVVAESPEDVAFVGELFRDYAAWLGFSLCFQNFDRELATLPGKYSLPNGRLPARRRYPEKPLRLSKWYGALARG